MRKPTTPLERHVAKWLRDTKNDAGYASLQAVYQDLMQGGCASGMVGHLVYYSDTLPFYRRHKKEINQMLADLVDETGEQPARLLRGWDASDPLAQDTQNQNLLAWFGFETAAMRLMD